jgi:hypothetical protein
MKVSPQKEPARGDAQRARASVCKIVFFYENFDAANRCRAAFDSIAHSLGNGREVEANSWSFSMLGATELSAAVLAEFNASVLADASRADVIVVAARGDKELPVRIAASIEACIQRSLDPVPLLLALPDEELEGEADRFCSCIEAIATRQGTRAMRGRDLKEPGEERTAAVVRTPPDFFARAFEIEQEAPSRAGSRASAT